MHDLLTGIINRSYRSLARAISLVENKAEGYIEILSELPAVADSTVIGLTGPPGAGKSTIADALIGEMVATKKKVGVVCVDPSSPFNFGALLGDRIRMNKWYNDPNVFIRSLANRGSLGGLNPSIIEITDVMKAFGFDYIIVETVGVGQSEVEIAGLADTTVIVLVPEAGDEVQTMKAGLMEIGDIIFVKNLQQILYPTRHFSSYQVPVVKTVAAENLGIDVLFEKIKVHTLTNKSADKHYWLLTEKAYHLINAKRMSNINKESLFKKIKAKNEAENKFNLYRFIEEFE